MLKVIDFAKKNISLLKNIQMFFHQKPRPSHVPTQSPQLQPFSINYLHNNPGARYTPKRLGRGPASNKGKTSGRGMKGHWSRSGGGPHVRFEGGQTPIQKRLPKYGRVIRKRPWQILDYVNLEKIDYYVKLGVLNPNQTITIKTLVDTGIVKNVETGVKILARGADRITYPLNFEVTDASKTAIDYIAKQGGSVKLIYRTPLKLKEHMFPHKYPIPLLDPVTPFWRVQKLKRKEQSKGIPIEFPKPKWLLQEEAKAAEVAKDAVEKKRFVYPVPIVQNSGKIRKRKPVVYRKFDYKLP